MSNEAYLKCMDEKPSNQRRLKSFRQLNQTRIMPSGNTTTDKLSDLQTGPYEVIEVEESGVDYLIKEIGSSAAPIIGTRVVSSHIVDRGYRWGIFKLFI